MKSKSKRLAGSLALGTALAIGLVANAAPTRVHRAAVKPAIRVEPRMPAGVQRPTGETVLSVGRGQLINLPAPMSDVFVSNEAIADVQVRSSTQLYVFGKAKGEATVYATTKGGAVVYSTNVRVGVNSNSLDSMLKLAMPDAVIQATPMNGLILLTGTVAGPEDSAEAERLVQAFVGEGTQVISRMRTATPLQVNLQVKIAEVSRSLVKEIGVNLLTRDINGSGLSVGVAQGRNFGSIGTQDLSSLPQLDASTLYGLPAGTLKLPFDPTTGQFITRGATVGDFKNLGLGAGKTSLGFLGRLFGLDVASALDLAENDGLVTTLAQPNLTALSGETASFLAGGEFPIPISQDLGTITIQYKQYGVSLAFTPTVLADGRISMRVRPEVSELSTDGSIVLNGFSVPALTTRRAETTVELGSGQSFVIGGLMRNTNTNSIDKAPGLGDVPVLGAMFRSNKFRRQETELMIIVTPYLVKPVSANQIALPTDGYTSPNDAERLLLGQSFGGHTGEQRPKPSMAPPSTVVRPQVGAMLAPSVAAPSAKSGKGAAFAAPGFSRRSKEIMTMRNIRLLPLLALGLSLAACGGTKNRGLESVHQPVVTRTDYVYDVPAGLNGEDERRLSGWLESLRVGYGDRISVDDPSGNPASRNGVAAVAARYGLLVDEAAPVTEGEVAPGTFRVIVSRSKAEVPGCPDWSRASQPEFGANTMSNYGCATNANLAAMVANPEDLIVGRGSSVADAQTAGKAIKSYRTLPPTGAQGLSKENTRSAN